MSRVCVSVLEALMMNIVELAEEVAAAKVAAEKRELEELQGLLEQINLTCSYLDSLYVFRCLRVGR